MRISILASGSKGNCSYLESNHNHYLIDFGMNVKYVKTKLKELDISLSSIKGIFITHVHDDHIIGLKVLLNKYEPTLFLSSNMHKYLSKMMYIKNYVIVEDSFKVDALDIKVIKASHDSGDIHTYIFKEEDKSLVYITDTGYINIKNHQLLSNHNLYVMESNHDIKLLMNGPYPHHLKQRILSDKGHLSNLDASNYLLKFIGLNTKKIILIHLSETNNDEVVALETLKNTFKEHDHKLPKVYISKQLEKTELIKVD